MSSNQVCEICEVCDQSVRFYEHSNQIWCEACAKHVCCSDCGCWYLEDGSGICGGCLFLEDFAKLQKEACAEKVPCKKCGFWYNKCALLYFEDVSGICCLCWQFEELDKFLNPSKVEVEDEDSEVLDK